MFSVFSIVVLVKFTLFFVIQVDIDGLSRSISKGKKEKIVQKDKDGNNLS
jgi:hypothetical protein